MSHYKNLVLEKSGTTLHDEHDGSDNYVVTFETHLVHGGYKIYAIHDQGLWENVNPDYDIFIEAASMRDDIENAINLGGKLYVDEEILDACELDDDNDHWEFLWNKWYGEEKIFNF